MGNDYFCFRPVESRRHVGGVAAPYFRVFDAEGPRRVLVFFSVRFGNARRRLRKTPPVGCEPGTFRSEVLTSSAAANQPPTILRESVLLKDRPVSPPPFPRPALALRWFRFASSVGLSVVSLPPLSAFGVGFAVVSFFFVCWFVGGFINFLCS